MNIIILADVSTSELNADSRVGFENISDLNGWFGENFNLDTNAHTGNYSLKLGDIVCSESSFIYKDIQGPGEIRFWWKKSPSYAAIYDLNFSIEDVCNKEIVVEDSCPSFRNWVKQLYILKNDTTYRIKWEFKLKNSWRDKCKGNQASSSWLDDVSFSTSVPPSEIIVERQIIPPNVIILNNSTDLQNTLNNISNNVIILEDGRYDGPIVVHGNNRLIKSVNPWKAQIDCQGTICGVALENAYNITIENITIYNSTGYGLQILNSPYCNLIENKITTNGHGIYIYESAFNLIKSNHIKTLGMNMGGIYLDGSDHLTVEGNIIDVADEDQCYIAYLENSCFNNIYDIYNGFVYDNGIRLKVLNGVFYPFPSSSCNHWWR